jgi:hypothetical protein
MQMLFSSLIYFIPACRITVYCGGVVQVLVRYGRKLYRQCLLCEFEIITVLWLNGLFAWDQMQHHWMRACLYFKGL